MRQVSMATRDELVSAVNYARSDQAEKSRILDEFVAVSGCGKRLKALVPILLEAMERHGHLQLAPENRTRLLAMSAATINRALRAVRKTAGGGKRRRPASSSTLRRSIPIRTFSDWQDPPPGFVEADLMAHSGSVTSGSFVQRLILTDVASGT